MSTGLPVIAEKCPLGHLHEAMDHGASPAKQSKIGRSSMCSSSNGLIGDPESAIIKPLHNPTFSPQTRNQQ
jgi:hypothetical protein